MEDKCFHLRKTWKCKECVFVDDMSLHKKETCCTYNGKLTLSADNKCNHFQQRSDQSNCKAKIHELRVNHFHLLSLQEKEYVKGVYENYIKKNILLTIQQRLKICFIFRVKREY